MELRTAPRRPPSSPRRATFEIRSDPGTGVLDMYAGPSETQVVPLGDAESAFVSTMFQWPGQPDESQHAALLRELENVRRRFAAEG